MSEANQSWILFGYDVRLIGHYFRAGWQDFLWGDDSPILAAVDETVQVQLPSGEITYYRAGRQLPVAAQQVECLSQAVVIPEELALARTIRIPSAAEANLDAVLALEVRSNSPFE
ncbi:MAG: general secretion pathway protein L, partial [Bacteroidia bacterium]